jgi:hypothetical protein
MLFVLSRIKLEINFKKCNLLVALRLDFRFVLIFVCCLNYNVVRFRCSLILLDYVFLAAVRGSTHLKPVLILRHLLLI